MKLTLNRQGTYENENGGQIICSDFIHFILGKSPSQISFDVRLNKFIGCRSAKVTRENDFVNFINETPLKFRGNYHTGKRFETVLHCTLEEHLMKLGLPQVDSEVYFRVISLDKEQEKG